MEKIKLIGIKVTEKQLELVEATAKANGFSNKSEYIRSILFHYIPISEKVDMIYAQVCKNGIGNCKKAE
jgi:metal-responsive CopG/Arc/MetJ family transcriptional regulator